MAGMSLLLVLQYDNVLEDCSFVDNLLETNWTLLITSRTLAFQLIHYL